MIDHERDLDRADRQVLVPRNYSVNPQSSSPTFFDLGRGAFLTGRSEHVRFAP